jgi:hypothetical protein
MGLGDASLDAYGYDRKRPVRPARVRFSAIGEGWDLFWDRSGTWLLTGLVVVVGNWALNAAAVRILGEQFHVRGAGFRIEVYSPKTWLHGVLCAVLNAFLLGGLFRMACLQLRGVRIAAGDLFGIVDVLPELVVGAALYGLALAAAGIVCFPVLPFLAAGLLMFTIPLIVDGRQTGFDAVRLSFRALQGQWLSATAFHFVAYVIAGLGACFACVGLLFTMPLYCLSVAVLYRDFFLDRGPAFDPGKPAPYDADLS